MPRPGTGQHLLEDLQQDKRGCFMMTSRNQSTGTQIYGDIKLRRKDLERIIDCEDTSGYMLLSYNTNCSVIRYIWCIEEYNNKHIVDG